jgi:hypothetical protein
MRENGSRTSPEFGFRTFSAEARAIRVAPPIMTSSMDVQISRVFEKLQRLEREISSPIA